MATMNISLPDALKNWVETRVAEGRFSNASDFVRDLIRKDQERAEKISAMETEIEVGYASGMHESTVDEFFNSALAVAQSKQKKSA
jgi:antitoxin ParD1/3/4